MGHRQPRPFLGPRLIKTVVALIAMAVVLPLAAAHRVSAVAVLPAGFSDDEFATGFGGRLTSMTFAPDGRLFVAEKQGAIRIVKNGTLLSRPFLTVPTATDSEKGLKGIAFDPGYASNRRVYVYYTDASTDLNKVSRFTTSLADPDVANPASEMVLVSGIGSGIYHSGGSLHFGSDGMLYVSTGDASYAPDAQNLTNLNGKILRINPDGSVPADNPYVGQSGRRPQIWAHGLRNPYTFAFDGGSARMYINDVGNSTWEEINAGQAGANYGWPACEGPCNDPSYVDPLYAYNHDDGPGRSITGAVFYRGGMFPASYTGDYFFGDYVGNYIKRFSPSTGTVSDFAANAANPVDLDVGPDGALYYLSVEARKVNRVAYGESPPPPPPVPDNLLTNGGFDSSTSWPAPWLLNVRTPARATLHRDTQTFVSAPAAARLDVSAASQDWHAQLNQPNIPLSAEQQHTLTFRARASDARSVRVAFQRNSDPYNVYFQSTFALTTSWASYSATFVPAVSDPRALLNVNAGDKVGQLWIDDVVLTTAAVTGLPPTAAIDAPTSGARFRAGDTISFSGSATDAEDGLLAAQALTWEVVFHHDQHTHPYVEPFGGVDRGEFTASVTGESSANIWYRIHLTATDSDGNKTEVTRDVTPITSTVSLATQPAGLSLTLDGSPISTPHSFDGVVNFQREIGAPPTQTVNGTTYDFVSWSDGGPATHMIATPASATTFTATYQARPSANAFVNPGFEAGGSAWLSPWRMNVTSPAVATIARVTGTAGSGTASARLEVTRSSLDWHVQLLQPNVPLVAGSAHTLSFWARAASNRNIRVAFQRNSAPYPVYFERTLAITTTWTRYTIFFTPSSNDARSLFNVNVGSSTGRIWLDGFSLTR